MANKTVFERLFETAKIRHTVNGSVTTIFVDGEAENQYVQEGSTVLIKYRPGGEYVQTRAWDADLDTIVYQRKLAILQNMINEERQKIS